MAEEGEFQVNLNKNGLVRGDVLFFMKETAFIISLAFFSSSSSFIPPKRLFCIILTHFTALTRTSLVDYSPIYIGLTVPKKYPS